MANLIEGLFEEMNRVRDLIKQYEELPDNAGFLGASMMKVSVSNAEKAISSGDIVKEVQALEDLKGFEG